MTIRRIGVMILRAVVTIGLLTLILYIVGAERVFERMVQADPVFLAVGVAISVLQVVGLVWRWQAVIRLLSGAVVGFSHLLLGMGRSMLFVTPLPSTVGGDVVRVVLLTPRLGLATAARSVICDRVLGLVALVVLVAALLPLFAYRIDSGIAFAVTAGTCLAGLVVTASFIAAPTMLAKAPLIGRYAATVGIDLRTVLTGGRTGMLCAVLAVANHLLSAPAIYFLAQAVHAPVAPLACLLIVPPALLISSIPISLGGWGLREGTLAAGFALIGANVGGAVAVAVMLGLLGPVIGAAIELIVPLVVRFSDYARRRA